MNNLLQTILLLICLFAEGACSKSDKPALYYPAPKDTVLYKESAEDFPNPDRGFYRVAETSADNFVPLDMAQLKTWRTLQPADDGNYSIYSSLVFRNIVLTGFTIQH